MGRNNSRRNHRQGRKRKADWDQPEHGQWEWQSDSYPQDQYDQYGWCTSQEPWQQQAHQHDQQWQSDFLQQPPWKRPRLIEDSQPRRYPEINNEKADLLGSMLLARALQSDQDNTCAKLSQNHLQNTHREHSEDGDQDIEGGPTRNKGGPTRNKKHSTEAGDCNNNYTVMVAKISPKATDGMMVQMLQACGNCTWRKPVSGSCKSDSAVGFCTFKDPAVVAHCVKLMDGLKIAGSPLLVKCDKKSQKLMDEYVSGLDERGVQSHKNEESRIGRELDTILSCHGFSSRSNTKQAVQSNSNGKEEKTPMKKDVKKMTPSNSNTKSAKKTATPKGSSVKVKKNAINHLNSTSKSNKKRGKETPNSAKNRNRISAIRFPELTSKPVGLTPAREIVASRSSDKEKIEIKKAKNLTPIGGRELRTRFNTPMLEQAAAKMMPLSALPARLQQQESPFNPTPAAVRVKSCSSKEACLEFSGSSRRKQVLVTSIVDKENVKVKFQMTTEPTDRPVQAHIALTPGKEYTVTNHTVETRNTPNTRSKKVVVSEDKVDIRAAHNKAEVLALYMKLLDFLKTTKTRQFPIQHFYRNKPAEYYEYAFYEQDNIMHPHLKDFCGSAGSVINGKLKGLFFSGFVDPRTGKPNKLSPFGEERLNVMSQNILEWKNNVYFADFYCLQQVHYVTVVITPVNSEADRFCADNLLRLRLDDNPILKRSPGNNVVLVASSRAIHVELFYTNPIDINRELFLNGYFSKTGTIGRGHATLYGPAKNKDCKICNL